MTNNEQRNKTITIFAGVNGAGKSTFYYTHCGKIDYGVRLNTDEILQEKKKDWRSIRNQIDAAKIVLKEQATCLDYGISFNRETTTIGRKTMIMLLTAKEQGYIINLIYIGLENLDLAKKRVLKRVQKGGHGVEAGYIESRYKCAKDNLLQVYKFFNNVEIYDNSYKNFQLVAKISEGNVIQKNNCCSWGDKILEAILSPKNSEEETIQ